MPVVHTVPSKIDPSTCRLFVTSPFFWPLGETLHSDRGSLSPDVQNARVTRQNIFFYLRRQTFQSLVLKYHQICFELLSGKQDRVSLLFGGMEGGWGGVTKKTYILRHSMAIFGGGSRKKVAYKFVT